MTEVWKPVVGYEGTYEVSDLGRVRSLDRVVGRPGPKGPIRLKGRLLAQSPDEWGYLQVSLQRDARSRTRKVHVLVLEAFAGPRPVDHEARHLNGDPGDARLCNLAWGTRQENWDDKRVHGTAPVAEKSGAAKLDWEKVKEIRSLAGKHSRRKLATMFGVSKRTIDCVVRGISWAEPGG